LELSDFLAALRRFWKSCLVVVCLAALAGLALALTLEKQYTASTKVYLTLMQGNSGSELASGANYAQTQVESFVEVATTPMVLDPAAEKLGREGVTPALLSSSVNVSVPTRTSIIVVSATRPDPQSAADFANTVADSLTDAVDTLSPRTNDGARLVSASVIAPAVPPGSHSFPSMRNFLAIGLLAGVLIAVGQALLRALLDKRIRSETQVEALTDTPIMGRIGFDAQLKGAERPVSVTGVTAEDYRRLRTNLQFVSVSEEDRGKSLVVTSAQPGEGKTAIAINLATVLAEAGESVLLIDGDLRRPRVARYLGLESTVGLTTVLIGWASPGDALQPSRVPNLTVMPSGVIPPNPSELLASRAMKQLIDSATRHFDYTIVDCAPLLPVTDAAILSRQTDGALLVADMQRATSHHMRFCLDEIERANGSALGLVLNKLRSGTAGAAGFHYYGEEYSSSGSAKTSGSRVARS
jgi:capsular exopolysaccharide synthesis family protein